MMIKKLLLLLICITVISQTNKVCADQVSAAAGVISRTTPGIQARIILSLIDKEDGKDVFELETVDDKLVIKGSSGVAICSGYNWYLKHYCNCHISWCGDQLNLPETWPAIQKKIRTVCLHKHRVYFNYCTLNYTASWWDWQRWQREIDIMALNGINMPLAPIGLEAVWYHALLKIGFTDEEARGYLVGPCYFAWQWMTNIQSHGGPLPKKWIDSHIVLGRQILERERELGMTPIQQGFSGCVPREFMKKFPDASIAKEGLWCGFEGTCQLDPLDPLFKKFGKIFLETEIELFGTSHIYAADPFHEGHPPKPGDEYLEKVGSEIWNLMESVDPQARWAMQAWSIRKPIASAAPKDRLLVLDLGGGRNDFWGYEYIKGQLHNFGGRINMHGDLRHVAANPFASTAKNNKLCAGMGLFMEGIEQNPVFYDMVFDMIWRSEPVAPEEWLNDYARRRYGAKSENATKAWEILLEGPYRRGTNGVESSSIIAARPALHVKKSGPNAGFNMPYNPQELVKAWQLLLSDYDKLKNSQGYQFDIMDIGRQVLSNLAQEYNKDATRAFENKDRKIFNEKSKRFIEILKDVDRLLATRDEYNFHRWVRSARHWGQTKELKDYYEWNASMLVSIWGPQDNPVIIDYSWREWAGLIELFYIPRWEMFIDHLDGLLVEGKSYQDPKTQTHGREAFRASDFYRKMAAWEIAWTKAQHTIKAGVAGDTGTIAKELMIKYEEDINYMYSQQRKDEIKNAELAKLKDQLGTVMASWNPNKVSTTWRQMTIDVTKYFDQAGEYTVTFLYSKGRCRLDIESVELLKNGEVVAVDKHKGATGNDHVNNDYQLQLKEVAFGTKYEIRAKVRSDGGNDSFGYICLTKKP
ncbi:MAG: alpha-N-acetylglucosaminidase [Phycisphaerae bacterium]|nr:alpha-N-acetylglucosaminidase [Phycisphaerae bacterium]